MVSISAGQRHTCAVLDDDSVYCWGQNSNGQLGTENSLTQPAPTLVLCGGKNQHVDVGTCWNCQDGYVRDAGDAAKGPDTFCQLAPTPPPLASPPPPSSNSSGTPRRSSPVRHRRPVTTVGDYVVHNFTSNGTFAVVDSTLIDVDVLVVGGGGAGACPTLAKGEAAEKSSMSPT